MSATRASSPRPSITRRSRRSWTAASRRSTSYCSLTRHENAFSVMAMNGISYGTSKSGRPTSSAAPTSAFGTRRCPNPVPSPSPARPCSASSATKRRWRAGVPSWMPVVRSSSPPDSHRVGSSSSEMCTQRIGRSSPAAPAASSSPQSPTSSATVSILGPPWVRFASGLVPNRLCADASIDEIELGLLAGPRPAGGMPEPLSRLGQDGA